MYRGLQRSGGGGCGCGCSSRDGDGDGDDDRGGKEASPCSLPTAAALAASRPAFAAEGRRERVISLGGLSKWGGAPGLRVGWLATKDRALLGSVGSLRDHTTICNSAPSEGSPGCSRRDGRRPGARRQRSSGREAARSSTETRRGAVVFRAQQCGLLRVLRPGGVDDVPAAAEDGERRDVRRRALQEGEGGGRGAAAAVVGLRRVWRRRPGEEGPPGPPAWIEGRFRLGLGRRDLPAALEALGKLLEKVRGEGKGPLL